MLIGYQKGGLEFIKVFEKLHKKFVVIDYDPDAIDILEARKVNYLYGDTTDIELLEEAGIDRAKLIVCTVGDFDTNSFLVGLLEKVNPQAVVIGRAESVTDAEKLYELGASYVMMPHFIGSEKISSFIRRKGINKAEFRKYREKSLATFTVSVRFARRKLRRIKIFTDYVFVNIVIELFWLVSAAQFAPNTTGTSGFLLAIK